MSLRTITTPLATVATLLVLGYGVTFWAASRGPNPHLEKRVSVFAAAGAMDVLGELAEEYQRRNHVAIDLNFASSSTLARQIEAGAPAEVYLSANSRWIDHLERAGLLTPGSRRELTANRLVLIVPKGEAFHVEMTSEFNLAEALPGRLAMGDPGHVPAGIYAREALERLGWYTALSPRVVPCESVRMALATVELREAAAGIVYATDAQASRKVEVAAVFPAELHSPIRFSAALCPTPSPEAARFLDYLSSPAAVAVFHRYGFTPLTATGDVHADP